jgi:hypothetical protein
MIRWSALAPVHLPHNPIASPGGGPNATVSSDSYFWNARLQQRFTSGANLDLFFNNSRDATNNAFNVLNPQFNNTLGFNFTQPLFRNLKIDPFRREIRVSKKQLTELGPVSPEGD